MRPIDRQRPQHGDLNPQGLFGPRDQRGHQCRRYVAHGDEVQVVWRCRRPFPVLFQRRGQRINLGHRELERVANILVRENEQSPDLLHERDDHESEGPTASRNAGRRALRCPARLRACGLSAIVEDGVDDPDDQIMFTLDLDKHRIGRGGDPDVVVDALELGRRPLAGTGSGTRQRSARAGGWGRQGDLVVSCTSMYRRIAPGRSTPCPAHRWNRIPEDAPLIPLNCSSMEPNCSGRRVRLV